MDFPAPSFKPAYGAVEPVVGEWPSRAAAPGHPILPAADLTILLPPDRAVSSVEIAGAPARIPGPFLVAWGQEPQHIGSAPLPRTPQDPAVYGSDATYPDQPAVLTGTGYFRGYRLVSLVIRPVQVRPKSGGLLAWGSMEVRLHLTPSRELGRFAAPRGLPGDFRDLSTLVANPESAFATGQAEAGAAPQMPYLIVTPERLRPAFERLLQHRGMHGMQGQILTMETIRSDYPGRDDAEKVRNAIAQEYRDRGATFALLGGDDVDDAGLPLVPVRFCAEYDNTPSDYYFGALDGDWDADGDGVFCEATEVDYYSEVHIGRATVDTLAEANHWVDKVIAFESGLPEERRRDLLFLGEKLDNSTWGEDAKENIAAFIPADYAIEKLYARRDNFSAQNVINSLNRGPQLTNHDGHASWDYVMGIGIGDVEALVNPTGFFSYSIGCYSGAFDQSVSGNTEAISEHFLLAPHAGIGVVMNGRYGWYYIGSPTGLSADLDRAFYHAMFTEGLDTLGEANDDARADNVPTAQTDGTMRYCFLETNLHGDPATPAQLRRTQLGYASHRTLDADPAYGNGNGSADPEETVGIPITLTNSGGTTAGNVTARLSSSTQGVTVHDNWAAWPDIAAGQSAENLPHHFSATIDLPCGSNAEFRLEVHHDGVVDVSVFVVPVGAVIETVLLDDSFETDQGWTSGGTVARGAFVRADPNGVTEASVGPVQPEDDNTPNGTLCWVTENPVIPPGGDSHAGDVDRGTTYMQSPAFNGTGAGQLKLRFARWFHRTGVGPLNWSYDLARVSNDNGANWVDAERLESNNSQWVTRELDLGSLVTPTASMRLRFEATEGMRSPPDPLTELLIDDVRVFRRAVSCASFTPGETMPPNPVGDTLQVSQAGDDVLLRWTSPPVDSAHEPARFYPAYRSGAPSGGFSQIGSPTDVTWRDCESAKPWAGSLHYLLAAGNAAGTSGEEPIP